MTKQEIFNQSVIRTMQQGCKSGVDGHCEYLSANGNRCPVGHVMTEEEVQVLSNVGNVRVQDLWEEGELPERLVPHLKLLEHLQGAHDFAESSDFRADFWSRAQKVAVAHGLKMPEI